MADTDKADPGEPERRRAREDQRQNDLAGADDYEAGAEEVVGPEDESRAPPKGEPSAAQKVKDGFPKP